MERKLASIRRIAALDPIPGADLIETATVDGWKLVVKKGDFKVDDLCVYFEIDSFLPKSDIRYDFLMKGGVRVFEGVEGHKLRTIKLRGTLSQGLALSLHAVFDIVEKNGRQFINITYNKVVGPNEHLQNNQSENR